MFPVSEATFGQVMVSQIKYHQPYLRHTTDIGYAEIHCLHRINGRFFVLRIVRRMLINVPCYGHLLLQFSIPHVGGQLFRRYFPREGGYKYREVQERIVVLR